MTTTLDITERLTSEATGLDPELWLPLLRLLAKGQPVELSALVAASGKTTRDVIRSLAAVPDTEYDDEGRIVGQGLTLNPTPHHFLIDGTPLYTWCALDTLIFPAVLGASAVIESSCHTTGVPVRLTVDATGVSSAEPATAVVSLLSPDDMSSVRSAFCNQVHFFASAEAAAPWLAAHPGGTVVSADEAYQLGTTMAHTILQKTISDDQSDASPAAASCC
ncbi:MAG: organomercurial lyase MerB [Actinomycetota bacterium]